MSFGKLGGQIKTGKFLDFRQSNLLSNPSAPENSSRRGMNIKRLLISVLRGLGVSQDEIDRNGDGRGFGSWPDAIYHAGNQVATLRDWYPEDEYHDNHSKPMPYLVNTFKV
jgi:hypothetical protein